MSKPPNIYGSYSPEKNAVLTHASDWLSMLSTQDDERPFDFQAYQAFDWKGHPHIRLSGEHATEHLLKTLQERGYNVLAAETKAHITAEARRSTSEDARDMIQQTVLLSLYENALLGQYNSLPHVRTPLTVGKVGANIDVLKNSEFGDVFGLKRAPLGLELATTHEVIDENCKALARIYKLEEMGSSVTSLDSFRSKNKPGSDGPGGHGK